MPCAISELTDLTTGLVDGCTYCRNFTGVHCRGLPVPPTNGRATVEDANISPSMAWLSRIQSDIGDRDLHQDIPPVVQNHQPKASLSPYCHCIARGVVCVLKSGFKLSSFKLSSKTSASQEKEKLSNMFPPHSTVISIRLPMLSCISVWNTTSCVGAHACLVASPLAFFNAHYTVSVS